MNKKSTSQSAFTLRLLVASVFCAASVVITLLGFGAFSVQAQQRQQVIMQSTDPLVPVGFDCSRVRDLGIDKQENLRAGAIMIACGEAQGGTPSASSALFEAIKNAVAPLAYGVSDVDLVTGTETSPNVTQSETFTASNPDNPNQIVVAYNDSRGRNVSPINISGASVSTDGGTTFCPPDQRQWPKPVLQHRGRSRYSVQSPNWHVVHRLARRGLRRSGSRRIQVDHTRERE